MQDIPSVFLEAKRFSGQKMLETLVWEVGPLRHKRLAYSFFIVFDYKPKLIL